MKKLLIALALLSCVTTMGCETRTKYGSCRGILDRDKEDPTLNYEVSTRNVIVGLIFLPSVFWPVLTGALWLYCPEGKKAQ